MHIVQAATYGVMTGGKRVRFGVELSLLDAARLLSSLSLYKSSVVFAADGRWNVVASHHKSSTGPDIDIAAPSSSLLHQCQASNSLTSSAVAHWRSRCAARLCPTSAHTAEAREWCRLRADCSFPEQSNLALDAALEEELHHHKERGAPTTHDMASVIQSVAQLLSPEAELLASHPDAPSMGNLGTGNFSTWTLSMVTPKSDFQSMLDDSWATTVACSIASAVLCALLVVLTAMLASTNNRLLQIKPGMACIHDCRSLIFFRCC